MLRNIENLLTAPHKAIWYASHVPFDVYMALWGSIFHFLARLGRTQGTTILQDRRDGGMESEGNAFYHHEGARTQSTSGGSVKAVKGG